ncbi:hypothetical protein [Limnohabitans lacus]|uniref:Uncharacterized protein n=1 Tax=Limnohabitans lacus TaxID=3045173 RepID=A0ABT6XAH9_9BURK|nr:hypothetical protein [Limnohabitans sp. HM2-2]MDI9235139.1 hypothetical protein [Limnohabitans sp. HM2-2]
MGFSQFILTFALFFFEYIKKETKVMELESTVHKKRKDLEYLLQGIDLNAIELEIAIRNGSRKIERLFWLICTLLSVGFTSIALHYLHQYKYI